MKIKFYANDCLMVYWVQSIGDPNFTCYDGQWFLISSLPCECFRLIWASSCTIYDIILDFSVSMSVPMRRTTSMLEFPRPDLYTSVYSPATENVGAGTGMVHVLSERLEEQNRVKIFNL